MIKPYFPVFTSDIYKHLVVLIVLNRFLKQLTKLENSLHFAIFMLKSLLTFSCRIFTLPLPNIFLIKLFEKFNLLLLSAIAVGNFTAEHLTTPVAPVLPSGSTVVVIEKNERQDSSKQPDEAVIDPVPGSDTNRPGTNTRQKGFTFIKSY